MKMSVIGCGHLGTTHAACMASIGHEVIGIDIAEDKVSLLNCGKAWFHEPGLDAMLGENIAVGRLRFTTELAEAAAFASVHFIGVATPGNADGSYDLSQLFAALSALVPLLRGDCLIIGKSTVPPGTAARLQELADELTVPGEARVDVVWNPEFLREGCAVEDTLRPDRIVVGASSVRAEQVVREVYQPLTDAGVPLLVTDLATAELAKGAANAFLATKISFINAMADICALTGADVGALARSLQFDPRIGKSFLTAGMGYGGACLPKDVRGLGAFARQVGAGSADKLLTSVDEVNAARGGQVLEMVEEAAGGSVTGKRVAVWGGAFKAGTDDVRDSVGLRVADQLRVRGADVLLYDPMASGNALSAYPELGYADSAEAAAAGAEVIVVVTAWPQFAEADPADLASLVSRAAVVDACQGIPVRTWLEAGWQVSALTGVSAAARHPRVTGLRELVTMKTVAPESARVTAGQRTVLMVAPYFPPALGGLEQYVSRLAEQLPKRHGWRVVIVTSGAKRGADSHESTEWCSIYRLGYSLNVSHTPLGLRWMRRIRSIVAAERPDVINVHLPVPGIADIAAVAAGKIPVVVTYHSVSMRKGIFRYDIPILAYERIFGRVLLRKAARIICVSESTREFLRDFSGKSLIVPPAVDVGMYTPAHGERGMRLLYVSNMTRAHAHKGLGYLLAALANPICGGIGLDVIGDGDGRPDYEAECARLGITDRVRFLGGMFGTELAARYREAYALVQPSLIDNIPTTVIEAMASGLPVIGTSVASTHQLIEDGVSGYLVPAGDARTLASAIGELYADPARATAMGKAGRARAESLFPLELQAERTSAILAELATAWRARAGSG